ncbi:MAG: hypothetical protein Q9173_006721 [Seirophora scorigena]
MSTAALLRLATRNQPHRTLFRSTHCCPTAARRLTPCLTGGYGRANTISTSLRRRSADSPHGEETFEEFSASARHFWQTGNWLTEIVSNENPDMRKSLKPCRMCLNYRFAVYPQHHRSDREEKTPTDIDSLEFQRNLNNCFAYDLVPSPSVITAALRAARRVNDFPTAVRIFEGIQAKVENQHQYEEYLEDLKPLREELGVNLKSDLYPDPPS